MMVSKTVPVELYKLWPDSDNTALLEAAGKAVEATDMAS